MFLAATGALAAMGAPMAAHATPKEPVKLAKAYPYLDAFLKLPASEKSAVLLHTAVLSNESEAEEQGLTQANLADLEQVAKNISLADVAIARSKTAQHLPPGRIGKGVKHAVERLRI